MQGCYLRISRDVGWDSLQMEFIAVDCPGLVMHRLWGVPRSRLTYTLQRAQHSATWRKHTCTRAVFKQHLRIIKCPFASFMLIFTLGGPAHFSTR